MKDSSALKFTVTLYTVYALFPTFLILYLPNTAGWLVLKIFLGLFLIGVFISGYTKFPELTLQAYVAFLALLFTGWWFLFGTIIGWIASFVLLLWIYAKFKFVNRLLEIE